MPKRRRTSGFVRCLMAGVYSLSLLALSTPASAGARMWQPLVVKGAELSGLLGRKTDDFEVLVMHDGKAVPIPFQIDERLPDGSFALPDGPEPVADDSPGIFDRDDEIVMMLSDLDGLAKADELPKGVLEIQVSDPLGGGDRYAYVAAVASPERSKDEYVDYDSRIDRIDSEHYWVGMHQGAPVDFAVQSYKRESPPSMIRAFRVRIHAKVLSVFDYSLTEHNVHTRLLAWKAGPVRVIRKEGHSIDLLMGIRSPEVASQVFFYRDYIENPVKVKLPWVPSEIFGDIQVRAYLDVIGSEQYRLAWSGRGGLPVPIAYGAPEMLSDESLAPVVAWVSLTSGDRLMLQTVVPSEDMKAIQKQLYYRDETDPVSNGSALRLAGARPHDFDLGYRMMGWDRLSSGNHYFDSLLISAPGTYSASALLEEIQTTPMVKARPVEVSR